jgi:hypothetical protein
MYMIILWLSREREALEWTERERERTLIYIKELAHAVVEVDIQILQDMLEV